MDPFDINAVIDAQLCSLILHLDLIVLTGTLQHIKSRIARTQHIGGLRQDYSVGGNVFLIPELFV